MPIAFARSDNRRLYLVRETAISMLINAALSALFVFLVFGGRDRVGLWGSGGLAVDFLPQTFIIAFMATFVPSALTRRALRKGTVPSTNCSASRLPRNLLVRSLAIAALVSLIAVPAMILVVATEWGGSMRFSMLLPLKIAYGAGIACMVTCYAIRAALSEGPAR